MIMARRSPATSATRRSISPTTQACTSPSMAAPSPRRLRRSSPDGRSKSRISSSSATAWAASSREAPAPMARRRASVAAETAQARLSRNAASRRAARADRQLGRRHFRQDALCGRLRQARQGPQLRRHRPALREPHGRGLAGPRSLRPRSDARRPVPLPEGVACYAVAATTASSVGGLKDRLIGDGLVPVASALGRHEDPARGSTSPPAGNGSP